MTPIGCRVAPVTPEKAARNANFSHITRRMSAASSASMPALVQAARKACATSPCSRSTGPKRRRAICPVCRITPGSAIVAAMYAAPPMTCAAPTIEPTRSMLSTPFWKGMTTPPPASSGRIAAAAISVSQSLTANRTTSNAPSDSGSSLATAFATWMSPAALFTTSPRSRIAARCRPRATNATSCPACASFAPK